MMLSLSIAIVGIVLYATYYNTGWAGSISLMMWFIGVTISFHLWDNTLDRIKQLEKALEEKEESKCQNK